MNINHNALPSLIGLGLSAAAVMWSQPKTVRDGIFVSASTFAFTIAMHFAVKFVLDRFTAPGSTWSIGARARTDRSLAPDYLVHVSEQTMMPAQTAALLDAALRARRRLDHRRKITFEGI